ncbi:pantoate--beta-alanine ligase [Pullulanibacillus sp. KACC 23026]|uniref:pantoate--beta-alanine ligase n=1 Tax=Pullulanibacillus sp. KACC 23026 TaxID=3028315 RepID=UPI0023B1DCE1|nr:pantoate--beta-alanine ligase [Pullulanibacillus sp. KACC 23026]WEG11336.1 pantoate--beta-alanine ligase [Pullulanibacillus sp. KACC 23026]
MKVIKNAQEIQRFVLEQKAKGHKIGFVPTMGFLHEGHLSLMREAKRTTDINVVSVFVNPAQFGPNEDFETYPRDFEHDKQLVEAAGMDVLFYPSVEEIYSDQDLIQMTVTKRTNVLCGTSRPGHFDGVVTVLTKLFHLVQPSVAYFGMKDAQQVAVVQGLIDTLKFPIRIQRVQTVRESDGLAKSSRNVRLSTDERQEAPVIYQTLQWGRDLMKQEGLSMSEAEKRVREKLEASLKLGKVDYLTILSYPELEPKETSGEKILATAVFYKNVRLIDNIIISHQED